ncbi:C2H2 type zinc finger domain-containing protein [Arthroderma uncinatum]|uniref:C2H2 type zinc finger domain-containing protein n=1 Tax=Arthroderma uncinatum TaxID=74035 RepID=UPI00144A77F9|nr:C2H2 type zinc finger domain-containing protein [Arthroderma uncinatum]KAF3484142.1 C2H2 type zinc finger domain-containing protein [Arthroderma uncinatum]
MTMNYDSDDARNVSPPLEKQKIIYEPRESPAPFLPDKSESNSPVDKSRSRSYSNPSGQGRDPPNEPEIAYKSRQAPLRRDSSSCSSTASDHTSGAEEGSVQGLDSVAEVDMKMQMRMRMQMQRQMQHDGTSSAGGGAAARNSNFSQPLPRPDISMTDPPNPSADPPVTMHSSASSKEGALNPVTSNNNSNNSNNNTTTRLPSVAQIISNPTSQSPLSASIFQDSRPMLATPPTFKKLHTFPLESSRVQTLPALNSPPATISGNSPDGSSAGCQSLPSFRSSFPCEIVPEVLSKDHFLKNGVPQPSYPAVTSSPRQSNHSHSHSHGHNSSQSHIRRLSEQFYPTPLLSSTAPTPAYSQASPHKACDISNASTPSAIHQQPPWPERLKMECSMSQPHSHSQSLSQSSCEPGSQYSDTPSTGYPTPTDPTSQESVDAHHDPSTGSLSSSGMFKCNYPGCVALPFQTQYLLK